VIIGFGEIMPQERLVKLAGCRRCSVRCHQRMQSAGDSGRYNPSRGEALLEKLDAFDSGRARFPSQSKIGNLKSKIS
jgi:aldehyde:ferredoxin oxidoreductase